MLKKYRAYRRQQDELKQAELFKKTQTHDEWTLQSLYETEERNPRLTSFQINCDLVRVNGTYIEWVGEEINERPVFHNSSRDTYCYFKQGRWSISTTDPRSEIPQIFLTSSRNIPMGNFHRGDEQSWEIGAKGVEELELAETDNKIVDVSIKRGEDLDMTPKTDEEDPSTKNLRDKRKRETHFEALALDKCKRGHVGVRGWYSEEVTEGKVDILWHKQRKQNETIRQEMATNPLSTNRQNSRLLRKIEEGASGFL